MNTKNIYIPEITSEWIESIRGFATMYIFMAHLLGVFLYPVIGPWTFLHYFIYISGAFMLMSFFVISGYVITKSIYINKEKNYTFRWQSYLRNRVARFYPPLILALLISFLVGPIAYYIFPEDNLRLVYEEDLSFTRESISADPLTYLKNFFLLHQVISDWPTINNNGPLWTLGLEFWIYMGIMLVAITSLNYKRILGLIPLSLLIVYIVYDANLHLMQLGGLWVVGSIFALIQIYRVRISRTMTAAIVIILCSFSFYLLILNYKVLLPFSDFKSRVFQMSVMTLLVIIFALHHQKLRFPLSSIFTKLGRISLSLYIFHFPFFILFFYLLHPIYHLQNFITQCLIMLGVASLTFIIIRVLANLVDIDSKLYMLLKK